MSEYKPLQIPVGLTKISSMSRAWRLTFDTQEEIAPEKIAYFMERMNQILHIDDKNLQVVVQPAVITQVLQEEVAKQGLYYPPDPSSRGSCFIGGNLAENAGGPRAVKYGVTKDFVLNLEVVLPDGHIIRTGANTLKNSTGYNLTQLMIGSLS